MNLLWARLGVAVLLSGLTMYLSLGVNLSGVDGLAYGIIHGLLAVITGGAVFGLGHPIFQEAWRSLRRSQITLEHAFLIGVLGSLTASLYSSLTGQGAIYYEVVVILIAIYLFGQVMITQETRKQGNLAETIPGLASQAIKMMADGKTTELPVSEIKVGDHIKVQSSELIPTDGTIISGTAYLEQQAHTGETAPVVKTMGDSVLAGTRCLDGTLVIQASALGQNREIDRLFTSLDSQEDMGPLAWGLSRRILRVFVPVVLTTALLTGIVWTLLGYPKEGWLAAFTVTVVACPCALGIAVPLAVRRGTTRLRLLGLVPRNLACLERLYEVRQVIFDKTGTLSDASLGIVDFRPESAAPSELKRWIAGIQQHSTHPVARPLWSLHDGERVDLNNLNIEILAGRGISATFSEEGQEHLMTIGNHLLASERGLSVENEFRQLFIFGEENTHLATIDLSETIRSKSVETLKALKEKNLPITILTGDTSIPRSYRSPGISIQTGLTSAQKASEVRQLNQQAPVLYIGDGLNDCEAFQKAHLSISLESGSNTPRDLGDLLLTHDDLSVIPMALDQVQTLGRRLNRTLFFSFGYNLIGMTLATLGILHPVVAAILMFSASAFVIRRTMT